MSFTLTDLLLTEEKGVLVITTNVVLIGVVIILIIVGFSALAQYFSYVLRALRIAERCGLAIRSLKDRQLSRLIDYVPISADAMTVLRLIATLICLDAFVEHRTTIAVSAFSIGWLLDLFDGLKARAETARRGYPTAWGKYLDPGIDLVCFMSTAVVLARWYPFWLILSFSLMISTRVLLFFIIMIGRATSGRWKTRLSSNILPESIAGKFKTVFVAMSFGLIILHRTNRLEQRWAWWLLGTALVLEILSLIQQARRTAQAVYGKPSFTVINGNRRAG